MKLRKLVSIILAVVFVSGVGMMLWQILQYSAGQQSQDQAQQIAFAETTPSAQIPEQTVPLSDGEEQLPMDEAARFLTQINIWGLRQINPDVLGWLYIPDTIISYPVMQTDSRDGYLHLSWDRKKSSSGSIFLEHKNSRDFSDFNTILYGHHMANRSMFGTLKYFKDGEYVRQHPCVYVCTAEKIFRYEIFSVYDAPIDSDTYRLYFADEGAKERALEHYTGSSLLELEKKPTVEDSILTLSTCTGTGVYTTRIVVQAVMTGQWDK